MVRILVVRRDSCGHLSTRSVTLSFLVIHPCGGRPWGGIGGHFCEDKRSGDDDSLHP